MRDWNVGYNNVYYTAHLSLEEVPAFYHYLELITSKICDWIPNIPFPRIPITIDGEKTNLQDWYGGINSLFHIFVHTPIFNLRWDKTKIIQSIELPYFTAKRLFPDAFKNEEEYIDHRGYYQYYADRMEAWDLSEKFDILHKDIKSHSKITQARMDRTLNG